MIILTRSMIYINVVLIADRIEKKKNMDSYDLEKISDEYFKQIEIKKKKNPINDYHLST